VEAQKNIGVALKKATNPFHGSKYADLGQVISACKEALNENGIVVLQPLHWDEAGYYLDTILMHVSGESITYKLKLMLKSNDMQQLGSACSYARRYSLQSLLMIPTEDSQGTAKDDDGNAASGKKSKEAPSNPEDEAMEVLKFRIVALVEDLNITWDDVNKESMKMYKKNCQQLHLIELRGLENMLSTELAVRRMRK